MSSRLRAARPLLIASSALIWLIPAGLHAQAAGSDPSAPTKGSAAKRIFTPEDFARFAPRNALDMLEQVPGFTIRSAELERGLGQASENVLLNGQRVPSKSGGAIAELQKIPADRVERIEIVDAATLDIAGLSGQVANVVATINRNGGQFSWRPEFRPHYSDPIFTRGDVSYSGSTGKFDYTLGLDSQGNRSAAGGPTSIFWPDRTVMELREDAWHYNSDRPKLSARLTHHGEGSSLGNLNLAYQPYWNRYYETSRRDFVDDVDRLRTTRERTHGFNYEVGGDYAFRLGPGTLKLIGLRKFDHEPLRSTAIFRYADDAVPTGDRYHRDGRSGEWIGRGEYGWKSGPSDFQISAEAAFNTLDSVTTLFALAPGEQFEEVEFPGGTGRVQEDRYELLGTYGRTLSPALTVQLVLGGEYSTLRSRSDVAALSRSFFRPKGSLSLAWKPNQEFDFSLKLRRRVDQLNFYDFLASVNLTEDRENAGNLSLVPPQSWEVDLEGGRKLGNWGTTRLRLFARLIDDIVDIVPIGETGESPGNIDHAVRYGFEWESTFQLDAIGWRGAKLDTSLLLQASRLRDPLTGDRRPISDSQERAIEISLRHDVPATDWAWGGELFHGRNAKNYRLTEVGRLWEGPLWLSAFVEHKDVFGLTVRATAGNLLNARSRWGRTVFTGFRDEHPVSFIEKRNRLIGPVFSFSVRGNF